MRTEGRNNAVASVSTPSFFVDLSRTTTAWRLTDKRATLVIYLVRVWYSFLHLDGSAVVPGIAAPIPQQ